MYPANLKASIETCLGRHAIVTNSHCGTAWTLHFHDGPAIPAHAWIDDLWLCLDIPLDWKVTYRSAWQCLRSHAVLRGAAKFSVDARDRRLHLQAEIPIIENTVSEDSLEKTVAGLSDAISKNGVRFPEIPAGDATAATELLAAACTEAGWPCCRKSSGTLAVEIPGRHSSHAAYLALQGAGARITVALVGTGEFKGWARFGLSILLLSAAREARWARPYFERQKTGETAGFELCFPSLPSATALDHAFCALSTAIRLCSEEAMVIPDQSIARQFLLQRGHIQ